MSGRTEIIEVRPVGAPLTGYDGGLGSSPAPAAPGGDDPVNILKLVHSLLRGRYLLAIGLALVFGSIGAAAGWNHRKPMYSSTGSIHVLPEVVTVTGDYFKEKAQLPNFNSFVQLQVMRLRQTLVIAQALESPEWRAIGRGSSPDSQRAFRMFLNVGTDSRVNEIINVSFLDKDRTGAKVGVDCLLRAYYDLYGKLTSIGSAGTVATLTSEANELERRLAELTDLIRKEVVVIYGNDDITAISRQFIDQRLKLEQTIDQLKFDLAMRDATQGQGAAPGAAEKPARTEEEIAAIDDRMQAMLTQRSTLEHEIQRMRDRGVGAQHPEMMIKTEELDKFNLRIRTYVKMVNAGGSVGVDRNGNLAPVDTIDQLRAKLQNFEALLDKCKREAAEAGTRCYNVGDWKQQMTERRAKLAGINQRLDQIRIESKGENTGRIVIESFGEPGEIKDSRKKWAAAGFVGGAGFPIALILLWGLIDQRRYRYSDEADSAGPNLSLLGILPNLPKNLADPEEAAAAAHCVHRIRSILQIGGPARKVYAVTSSIAGDGKTSLTLSLGLSYAAAGSRTLLIDFDMIGGGLTSSLNAKTDHGLGEVLANGDLNGHIVATRTEGLSLLPVGRKDERYASRLSARAVRRVLDAVRDTYDVILIDTGPILGSLEAAFVSASVDGVILVVGRGQQRSHVERAIEQIRAVGGNLVGLVFNRASALDFRKSVSSTSMRSVGVYPAAGPPDGSGSSALRRLGPIAQTVALDLNGTPEPGHPAPANHPPKGGTTKKE